MFSGSFSMPAACKFCPTLIPTDPAMDIIMPNGKPQSGVSRHADSEELLLAFIALAREPVGEGRPAEFAHQLCPLF